MKTHTFLMKRLSVLAIAVLVVASVASADAPTEVQLVEPSDLPDSILIQVIAIANIDQEPGTSSAIPRFTQHESDFTQVGYLNLCGCVPFSRYGWFGYDGDVHSTPIGGVARFPVIEASGRYIRIVTNPHLNSSEWVERPQERTSWRSGLVWTDSLTNSPVWLDPFFLPGKDSVVVYDSPGGKPCGLLAKNGTPGALRAVEQIGDFVKVEAVVLGYFDATPTVSPVGWIRVRDPKGHLLVWLRDFCSC